MSRTLLDGHVHIICSPANSAQRPGAFILELFQFSTVSGFKTSINGDETTFEIIADNLPPPSGLVKTKFY
jgi:hypothetical protein